MLMKRWVFAERVSKRLLVAVFALTATAAVTQAAAETLILQGSTTFSRRLLEPYKSVIESDSKHELTVIPNKSMPGLIALMEGRAHMAMISAPLHSEIEQLAKVLPGLAYDRLQAHPVVSTRISIAIHPSNPVRKASLNQIRKALLGQLSNWSELSGKDQPIRVVLVGGGGGVTTVVESELLHAKLAEGPHIIYVKTPIQLVQVIEQEPGAVGFAQLSLTRQRGLPELSTEAPIEQTLSFITYGDPTPAMKSVIDAARRVAEKLM
jgi:ABC-type phosphate transport system substrate-binding protein